ncbi:MAG: lytic transglycosylase domain-containing protein [Deltaproteobacteria bacterium]|nr:lytic transglycosylase domain-containing protein [Deltaproteobacteria bacterium]
MQILCLKRPPPGIVIINLIRICGCFFLVLLVLSSSTSFPNRTEGNTALPGLRLPLSTLKPEKTKASVFTYDQWIRRACRKHSMDPALVMAVIHAESRFDPLAVSPKGAMGLMQLSPIITRELGIHDPFDPQINIDGGVRYLKDLLDIFDGDRELALAAYNAGPTQVYRHNGVPPFKETQEYLKRVFRYLTFYQNPPTENISDLKKGKNPIG